MGSVKVTALIPSYNHAAYLRKRIASVINQTYKDIELIVIDDGSQDDSDKIIIDLQTKYGFEYVRNKYNSGTPFSAWEKAIQIATGDYIWICESDDYAESIFLERAVAALQTDNKAVLFYCHSWIVDSEGKQIGHTSDYFHNIWKETRWDTDFIEDGVNELIRYQLRGQVVPNMSSALISTNAFCRSYQPFLTRLKLTGDWLFIGNVMCCGRVIFCSETLNNYRQHAVTSRVRVKSARSQAEFMHTKYLLFRKTKRPIREFAHLMRTDVVRFLYEPASLIDVILALCKISLRNTLSGIAMLSISTMMNRGYFVKLRERYAHAKSLTKL